MGLALWIAVLLAEAASCASTDPMPVRVWVDRTAVYPGDRIEYTARVEHSPDIEFVQDHVRKDQLTLEPFEILRVGTSAGDLPAGRRYFEVRLLLTTYDVGHADAAVPAFNLFYFRRSGAASKDTTPAETLAVPPLKIGLRSTIVDLPGVIRDEKPMLVLSKIEWVVPAVLGWCGLLGVVVYGSSLGIGWARTGFWKHKMTQRVRKRSLRESFDEIRQISVDSSEGVENFYSRASKLLRDLAAETIGDCGGMTAQEVGTALREAGDPAEHATDVASLLEDCDLTRYAPGGTERARANHPDFLRRFAELIDRNA